MKKQKLYFDRHYDQWKGLDIAIEEETHGYGLYIQIPDMTEIGTITSINAIFEGIEDVVNCEIYDKKKRIIRLNMPPQILSTDGVYKVSFTMAIKKGDEVILKNTAIQTFTILDTIEVSDEYVENYDNYSLLKELLENATDGEIDVSSFAKMEDVVKLIEETLSGIDTDTIISELEKRGLYIKPNQLNERIEALNQSIQNTYQTKFAMSSYPTKDDLRAYTKTIDLKSTLGLNSYAKLTDLNGYVGKETGKTLTSNDFTNELKNKLENMPEDGHYDDTELREMINTKASVTFVKEYCTDVVLGDDFYKKNEIDEQIENINKEHNNDIENLNQVYLKKEDYEYSDGIYTNDVKLTENLTLEDFIRELQYKEIQVEEFKAKNNIFEANKSISSVTLGWKINKTPNSIHLSEYGNVDTSLNEVVINKNYTTDTEFTLTVTDEKETKKYKTNIYFVLPYYYGTYSTDELTFINIVSQNRIIDKKESQTIKLSYEDSSVFFAYLKSYGLLEDIKDNNGLSYFEDFKVEEYLIGNDLYYVYKLEEKATVNNISFSFIFGKEENNK